MADGQYDVGNQRDTQRAWRTTPVLQADYVDERPNLERASVRARNEHGGLRTQLARPPSYLIATTSRQSAPANQRPAKQPQKLSIHDSGYEERRDKNAKYTRDSDVPKYMLLHIDTYVPIKRDVLRNLFMEPLPGESEMARTVEDDLYSDDARDTSGTNTISERVHRVLIYPDVGVTRTTPADGVVRIAPFRKQPLANPLRLQSQSSDEEHHWTPPVTDSVMNADLERRKDVISEIKNSQLNEATTHKMPLHDVVPQHVNWVSSAEHITSRQTTIGTSPLPATTWGVVVTYDLTDNDPNTILPHTNIATISSISHTDELIANTYLNTHEADWTPVLVRPLHRPVVEEVEDAASNRPDIRATAHRKDVLLGIGAVSTSAVEHVDWQQTNVEATESWQRETHRMRATESLHVTAATVQVDTPSRPTNYFKPAATSPEPGRVKWFHRHTDRPDVRVTTGESEDERDGNLLTDITAANITSNSDDTSFDTPHPTHSIAEKPPFSVSLSTATQNSTNSDDGHEIVDWEIVTSFSQRESFTTTTDEPLASSISPKTEVGTTTFADTERAASISSKTNHAMTTQTMKGISSINIHIANEGSLEENSTFNGCVQFRDAIVKTPRVTQIKRTKGFANWMTVAGNNDIDKNSAPFTKADDDDGDGFTLEATTTSGQQARENQLLLTNTGSHVGDAVNDDEMSTRRVDNTPVVDTLYNRLFTTTERITGQSNNSNGHSNDTHVIQQKPFNFNDTVSQLHGTTTGKHNWNSNHASGVDNLDNDTNHMIAVMSDAVTRSTQNRHDVFVEQEGNYTPDASEKLSPHEELASSNKSRNSSEAFSSGNYSKDAMQNVTTDISMKNTRGPIISSADNESVADIRDEITTTCE